MVSVCLPLNWLDADQSLIRDQVRRVCASVSAVDESRITVLVYREKIWTYCRFAERKEFINALKSAPASELYPVLDEYLSSVENDKSSCECTDLLLMTMEARKLLSIANQAQEKQNQYKSDESAALGESLHTAVTKAVTKEFAERGGRHEKKLIEQILAVFDRETSAWKEQNRFRRQGRIRQGTMINFDKKLRAASQQLEKAQLLLVEVLGLNLYTGPLFILYNAVLRGFPVNLVELLNNNSDNSNPENRCAVLGNRFETTIFTVCSGITKLSRFTKVPENRLLYRGLGGVLVPQQFWKITAEQNFRGGIEFGLMSTTDNRSVALQYSGVKLKRGVLFEISVGCVDIGASISFLSQYPGEGEFLMQPLSLLEVLFALKNCAIQHQKLLD